MQIERIEKKFANFLDRFSDVFVLKQKSGFSD